MPPTAQGDAAIYESNQGVSASTGVTTPSLLEAEHLNTDALDLLEKNLYNEAQRAAERALQLREQHLPPGHLDLAVSLNTLGLILHKQIALGPAQAAHERTLQIREQALGASHPLVAESLVNLARVLYANGQFARAQPLLLRSLDIRRTSLGGRHPEVGMTLNHLGIVETQLGNLADGRDRLMEATAIFEAAGSSRIGDLGRALSFLGNIYGRMGDFSRARPILERSLALLEDRYGAGHLETTVALLRLAQLHVKLGELDAGLGLLQRMRAIEEASLGPHHAERAGTLNELGRIHRMQGRLTEARSHFERALAIQEQTIGGTHPFVAVTLNELAQVRAKQGDIAVAETIYLRALHIQEESVGTNHPFLAPTLTNLGYLNGHLGRMTQAERYFARGLQIREDALGERHPDVAWNLMDLAKTKHAQGDLSGAHALYERARNNFLAQSVVNSDLDDTAQGKLWAAQATGLGDYVALLSLQASRGKSDADALSAVKDGFLVSQQARGWTVQAAVAKSLAQHQVTADSGDATLARQVEDLRRTRQELWNRLTQLYNNASAGSSNVDAIRTLKLDLLHLEEQLEQATKKLTQAAPRYAEMAQPRPVDIDAAAGLLGTYEALITFYTLNDRVQVWLIRRGQKIQYREVLIPRTTIIRLVDRLRASLTPIETPGRDDIRLPAFDVETAAYLYQQLLAPLANSLVGVTNLALVPDDILLPLPFAALLTANTGTHFGRAAELYRQRRSLSPQDFDVYTHLPWMTKSYPLTTLPSVSALKLLRQQARAETPLTERFIGFGDPVLQGAGRARGGTMVTTRGTRVARDAIQSLNRLPGTRDELFAVASALNVSPGQHVYVDQQATEIVVRQLNESGRLGQAKVVAFATHGLLAGELRGLSQPALVLTPPSQPSDMDDGLLSLEDVLQLRLPNTEWVILSACNTAGGDGSGESLSGLARAFFFAGARGLLVSQWSVDDRATQELMTQIFQRYGAAHSVPPAEALQQGMLALLQLSNTNPDRAYFAHPFAWASFFLVGEGRPPLR